MFKKVGLMIMAMALCVGLTGCGTKEGIIKVELYPDIAPITVANFEKLIDENYFDGTTFHRVIPEFMIQGGGSDKPADSITGEFASNGIENSLKHTRGVISMARTDVKDSATSQFFIMVGEQSPHLDGEYAAFGKVTSGIEYADEIVNVKRDNYNKPLKDQTIKTIRKTGVNGETGAVEIEIVVEIRK